MRINSRTGVSVVGTIMMVVMTVVLAAWSPSSHTPARSADGPPSVVQTH